MNLKMVFRIFGRIARLEGILLLLPALVALIYGEYSRLWVFLGVAAGAFLLGTLLTAFIKPGNSVIYAKDGFATVSVAWVGMSLIGALPFVISGEIPNFVDALFETISGFTTTGASILPDVTALTKGILFWRSFTHWLGGMGVLVFIMAIANNISDRTIHIMRAEMPGPVVGKLVPKVKDTAKILYLIYIGITVAEMVFLFAGGMTLYESAVHAFSTAGTGGFGLFPDSIASYSSYIKWVITVFMLLFGINFNLYFLVLVRRVRAAISSSELWVYLGIFFVSTSIMTANILSQYMNAGQGFGDALCDAAFTSAAITTTTGFAVADFTTWPPLSQGIIFILLFVGGMAGSTGGGFKISRVMLVFKMVRREFRKLIRPRSVNTITIDGKAVDEETVHSVANYLAVYMIVTAATFLLISFEPYGAETNISAAISCLNNVGPGFGMVGPMGGYGAYTAFSKLVLSLAMLLGRLEIYPILIALTPSAWRKK